MATSWLITDGFAGAPSGVDKIVTMGLYSAEAPDPGDNVALMSRTWVGVGVAVILLILVHTKWP